MKKQMAKSCNGEIKLPKYLINEGMDDSCHTLAYNKCQNCNKFYCHHHIIINKHDCIRKRSITKYKCNKCGLIAESKQQIPLEHGKMGIAIYPQENTSQKCIGNFEEKIIYLECSNCESSWDSCQYHLSEIGKSCCKECWHEDDGK